MAELGVRNLVARQGFGNDTGRLTSGAEGRVGHHAHQAHRGAAVDESDAAPGQ
ncbi:MAG TPA: hypothetical protein VND70_04210 [Acidimicrobiales bacterium]|nr:hypothetical protein [Acidimicrobiales bacterium]